MVAAAPRPHRPSLVGVLYAEDFDDDASPSAAGSPDPAPEPEIIEPAFTAAELDAARAEAWQAGRLEAEHGLAGSRSRMLGLLAAGIAEARAAAHEAAEAAAEGVASCMLSALAACLPAMCERHGAAELRALARTLLPALADEPRVTVRISPHMVAAIEAELASLDSEIAERVHLLPTDAIPPGDARVTWAEGSAVRDAGRARAAFEDGLAALGLLQREHADA